MPVSLDDLFRFTKQGWKIFPCHAMVEVGLCSCGDPDCSAPGKHPRTFNGVKAATDSPEQIRSWFSQWEDVNWAGATGTPSGQFVVDLDDKPNANGPKNMAQWIKDRKIQTFETRVVRTGGGGLHYVYKMPDDGKPIKNRTGMLPAVDVRGDGGYVMLPGSNHKSGGFYEVARDVPLAHAPTQLVDLIRAGSSGGGSSFGVIPTDLEFLDGIDEGARDDTLFVKACQLRRTYNDNRAAVTAFVLVAAAYSDPPFPKDKALEKVEQAFKQDHSDGDPFVHDREGFWDRREVLRSIYANAEVTGISPWGALAGAILRAIHTIPYNVRYRSYRGPASVNLGVINVGESGGNKSLTARLLDDMLDFSSFADFSETEAGSGEAIPDSYMYWRTIPKDDRVEGGPTREKVWATHAKRFKFDEVGKLGAMSKRDGSTIFEYIKSGLTGEQIGRSLAGNNGIEIPRDEYRFTISINAQPTRADVLLSDSEVAGGTPGRFLWCLMDYPPFGDESNDHMFDFEKMPTIKLYTPKPVSWDGVPDIRGLPEMDREHLRHVRRGNRGENDAIDGHAVMVRVKVAIGLMVLDGRSYLNDVDWELAGAVMDHSNATRARVQIALANMRERNAEAYAVRQAFIQTKTREATAKTEDAKLDRVVARLRRDLEERPAATDSQRRQKLRADARHLYDEAMRIIKYEATADMTGDHTEGD